MAEEKKFGFASLFMPAKEESSRLKSEINKEDEKEDGEKQDSESIINEGRVDPENGKGKLVIIMESMITGIEKHYFWILRFLQKSPNFGLGYEEVIKVKDIFDASVSSAFHGQIGSKISAIQQQVSNYLAQIGQMIKTLLPIVREIRIMDERLDHYKKSLEGDESAEIALKSIWIEVVEGGMNNPNSVYSMATKLGFITLPDLFFGVKVPGKSTGEQLSNVDNAVNGVEINKKVRDALAKKLFQYHEWKDKTYKEMSYSRKFRVKNLKQHWNVIRLYTSWLRPYLKTLQALGMRGEYADAELVGAFESSKVNIELLAVKKRLKNLNEGDYVPCIRVKFEYTTRPQMEYTKEQQRAPMHFGMTEISFESFALTKEKIENYVKKQELEDLQMIADIVGAMESLGEDVQRYLKEAEEGEIGKELEKKGEEKKPKVEIVRDFFRYFLGLELREAKKKEKEEIKKVRRFSKKKALKEVEEEENAKKDAAGNAWTLYDVFKKSNEIWTP